MDLRVPDVVAYRLGFMRNALVRGSYSAAELLGEKIPANRQVTAS